jgi:hypothetical protein
VYVTEHDPELKMQLALLLKVPVPLLERLTVPPGVVFVPASVSVTVAVQVVAALRLSGLGEQLTAVEVERELTV